MDVSGESRSSPILKNVKNSRIKLENGMIGLLVIRVIRENRRLFIKTDRVD